MKGKRFGHLVLAVLIPAYVELFPVVWWLPLLLILGLILFRSTRLLGRLVIRFRTPVLAVVAVAVWYWRTGWVGLLVPPVVVLAAGAVWRWRWPDSWRRQVVTRARGWWRARRFYRPRWRHVLASCGLVVSTPTGPAVPQITSILALPDHDRLTLLLPPGQAPTSLLEAGPLLAHGLRVHRVAGRDLGCGQVALTVFHRDPIAGPIVPSLLPAGGRPLLRTDVTPEEVTRRLSQVPVGRTEDDDPWFISVRPGSHMLVHGTTGAGKSGLLWAILWSLADLIVSGWVEVVGFDPKVVELRPVADSGLGVVHRTVAEMPAQLARQVEDMDARFGQMDGRDHVPSPDSPVRLVIVDELAVLTALADNNKVKGQVENALGALQSKGRAAGFEVILSSVDATKETVRWRPLCDTRIVYRTGEAIADMVFGEGAHDRGVRTEDIPATMPGTAYARGRDGHIVRARTLHITDQHIAVLTDAVRAARATGPALAPAGTAR